MKPVILIPARMASSRLPGKPLANIHGKPMIVHVLDRAENSNIGPVYVACAETEIAKSVSQYGGQAIQTDADLPSGTDRVRAAIDKIDPDEKHDIVINLQGDMPTIEPEVIVTVLKVLQDNPDCDIATAAVKTLDADEISDPNVVKAVITTNGRALYFTRATAPSGEGPVLHHIGVYAYRRTALSKFCELPPSPLEKRERLEQLRALEAGMTIYVAVVKASPIGVDTQADLERVRQDLLAEI